MHFSLLPWLWCLVSVGALDSLRDQSPNPWLWWILRDPRSYQQHHGPTLPGTSPGFRGKTFGCFIFSVCNYNCFPTVMFFPCSVLKIKASLACWVSAWGNVLLLLLYISLHLVLWNFSSNSSFSACSCLRSALFSILTLASNFLIRATLFSVRHTPGTAAAILLGSSFLPQSGCQEAAGVLQLPSFCLSANGWPQISWGFLAFGCALHLPGRCFCSPYQP